jgi:CRP-like cAMP-binding protein
LVYLQGGGLRFAPLDGVVLERLAAGFGPLSLPTGTVIIAEGEPGERFYLIDSGEVSVLKTGVEVARLGAGDYFGEISSSSTRSPGAHGLAVWWRVS